MSWTLIQNPKSKIQNCFVALLLTPHPSHLSNYFVRSRQHVRRNREPDLLRGFEIDHQLKFRRPLDREFARFGSPQNPVNVSRGAAIHLRQTYAVRHEPTCISPCRWRISVYCRQPLLIYKVEYPYPLAKQNGIPFDDEAVHRCVLDLTERLLKIGYVSHFDGAKPHAETSRNNLHLLQTNTESRVS